MPAKALAALNKLDEFDPGPSAACANTKCVQHSSCTSVNCASSSFLGKTEMLIEINTDDQTRDSHRSQGLFEVEYMISQIDHLDQLARKRNHPFRPFLKHLLLEPQRNC